MHALLKTDDFSLGIDKAFELQEILLIRCASTHLVRRVGITKDESLITLVENLFFMLKETCKAQTRPRRYNTNVCNIFPAMDPVKAVGVWEVGVLNVIEHVKCHITSRFALGVDDACRIAITRLTRRIADDKLTVAPLQMTELRLYVKVGDGFVAARIDDTIAHSGANAVEFRTGQKRKAQFVEELVCALGAREHRFEGRLNKCVPAHVDFPHCCAMAFAIP